MIDWLHPLLLLLIVPVAAWLWFAARKSVHPMGIARRRALTAVRLVVAGLAIVVLAGPAWRSAAEARAVVVVLDHSQSQGSEGQAGALAKAQKLIDALPAGTPVAAVSAGAHAVVLRVPSAGGVLRADPALVANDGGETDLAAALDLARGLFPQGHARQLVLIGDGLATRGDLTAAGREAALAGIQISALPHAGPARPDVRVVRLTSSRVRSHEGAAISLIADLESSLTGSGRLVLYENGIAVETRPATFAAGSRLTAVFQRTPAERNLYTYKLRAEGFAGDLVASNDTGMALVDVAGQPRLLHVAGEAAEAHYLAEAMAREGIRLDARPPAEMPSTPQELSAYDGVVLADVPARLLSDRQMEALRSYVGDLGGGLLCIGGANSFGVGGWYRTPIEELLPVKLQSPDTDEKASVGLCLVIDRSGSMGGDKIECVKSAAIAAAGLLTGRDFLGVSVFDSEAEWAVPMVRVGDRGEIERRIASISIGGGTYVMPGMVLARDALQRCPAKVKHMIVLTDGQTGGSGYPEMAAALRAQRITVSTVAVGDDADTQLLQAIATSGGGTYYLANDPNQVVRIFTQDTMTHTGQLLREVAFTPRQAERHPMLDALPLAQAPTLLGYVRTVRRTTAQVPLITDLGDPLLAHWRFGLGKVTAFTSDSASRWAGLWLANWPGGYVQFWSQVVRETAREPQGRRLDLTVSANGRRGRIAVDALADAAAWRNLAEVSADVFHVPPTGSAALAPVASVTLTQDGPGRYVGAFDADAPGVYLVRARSGGDLVTAGLVQQHSAETASGLVDLPALRALAEATGGTVLAADATTLPKPPPGLAGSTDLRPALLLLLLLAFLIDLGLRRYENLLGLGEALGLRLRSERMG